MQATPPVADRVDDGVEVVTPVDVPGEQDLRPARALAQHVRVRRVFLNHLVAAVDHAEVRRVQDLVGHLVVRGQQHDLVVAEAGGTQRGDEPGAG
jgi:hypothetical protein